MKIGFFGGSFNPPTNAHINLAKKALETCMLDKIIFIPMGDFYKKKELAESIHRYSMLKIACENSGTSNFEVSDMEIVINQKLDTIDAFRLIEKKYPNDERYFIMGADNFIKLIEWKESDELINKYNYIVLERKQYNLQEYINKHKELKKCISKIIENPEYKNSSSTEFRKLLKEKLESKQQIISKEVLNYIIKHNID